MDEVDNPASAATVEAEPIMPSPTIGDLKAAATIAGLMDATLPDPAVWERIHGPLCD